MMDPVQRFSPTYNDGGGPATCNAQVHNDFPNSGLYVECATLDPAGGFAGSSVRMRYNEDGTSTGESCRLDGAGELICTSFQPLCIQTIELLTCSTPTGAAEVLRL